MKKKIFVTVGSTYPLDRLVKEIDNVGKNKNYEIFAQIGESNYTPKKTKFEKFLSYEKMQEKIKWSDIIISHAGVGTIIDALNQNKQLLLFPRLKKYDEAVDDHQIEICKAFEKKYNIKYTLNEKELNNLIKITQKTKKIKSNKKLVKEVKKIIYN